MVQRESGDDRRRTTPAAAAAQGRRRRRRVGGWRDRVCSMPSAVSSATTRGAGRDRWATTPRPYPCRGRAPCDRGARSATDATSSSASVRVDPDRSVGPCLGAGRIGVGERRSQATQRPRGRGRTTSRARRRRRAPSPSRRRRERRAGTARADGRTSRRCRCRGARATTGTRSMVSSFDCGMPGTVDREVPGELVAARALHRDTSSRSARCGRRPRCRGCRASSRRARR